MPNYKAFIDSRSRFENRTLGIEHVSFLSSLLYVHRGDKSNDIHHLTRAKSLYKIVVIIQL